MSTDEACWAFAAFIVTNGSWAPFAIAVEGLVRRVTIHERHEDSFSGTHDRHVLHSTVTPCDKEGAAA